MTAVYCYASSNTALTASMQQVLDVLIKNSTSTTHTTTSTKHEKLKEAEEVKHAKEIIDLNNPCVLAAK
jgi:hypothetical protein